MIVNSGLNLSIGGGRVYRSDGTIANEADGIDQHGNRRVVLAEGSSVGVDGIENLATEATVEAVRALLASTLDVELKGRRAETIVIAMADDISGVGVQSALSNYSSWTLFLKAAAAVDVTIELSPDEGTTWYRVEDDVALVAAKDEIIEFGFRANRIRLTGSNAEAVTAHIRGVL